MKHLIDFVSDYPDVLFTVPFIFLSLIFGIFYFLYSFVTDKLCN